MLEEMRKLTDGFSTFEFKRSVTNKPTLFYQVELQILNTCAGKILSILEAIV